MSTSKEHIRYILDQLAELEGITSKQMMGEYIIYFNGKIAAYVCDNRLLVKPLKSVEELIPNPVYEPPYDGADDMVLVEDVDDREFLKKLFAAMEPELPEPKKRRK